jgi:hypothetical protein
MAVGVAGAMQMAISYGNVAAFLTKASKVVTEIKDKVMSAFDGVKNWITSKWPPILTKAYWTNDEGTGVLDPLLRLKDRLAEAFSISMSELSVILTREYWTNESGTGVLDPILNLSIDWDAIFDFLIPDWVTTFIDNFDLSIDWDGIFDFLIPDWVTTFIDNFDLSIDWDGIFDFLIPDWVTTFIDNFDLSIDWDGIFNFIPEGVFTKEHWTNDEGTGVLDPILNFDVGTVFSGIELPDVSGMIKDFEFPDVEGWLDSLDWAQLGRGFVSIVLMPMDALVMAMNALFDSIVFERTITNPLGDDWTIGLNLSNWDIPIPSTQVIDLIGLAEGGIVTGPTLALIGEAGPEAVIPLDKGGAGGMGGTYNMTFNLSGLTDRSDKRQYAQEISRLIQQEMRRTVGAGTTRGRY